MTHDMTNRILLLFISIMGVFPAFSQIKGIVTNLDSQPVEFANVALYALSDTVNPRHGTVTDSVGFYRISEDISAGDYQLRVSFLGFKTAVANFRIPEQNAAIELNFTLEPDETVLAELVVEGLRPVMKVEAGKLTYHIPALLKDKPVVNAYETCTVVPRHSSACCT